MTSDPSRSLCDDMDYTSDMNKDKKRWLFHGVEKNIQNTKQRKKKSMNCLNVIVFIWNKSNRINWAGLYD